ncbi:hypothetical protein DVR12_23835 [Chitinophaga silvatica]|uniref:Uncharacterized protein n=1 Tax=Chitinophaga silvatica TaxID=2282649 RepID=A0A3E1Y3K0_9BACT|nr:hypothetical protein [Chitinophaga silvatica]RFS19268.1 hypothetical protein DVR12_23835 [Chitinophaga silvatica]
MYVVRVEPEASAFLYNAAAGDFIIKSELKFVFRPDSHAFVLRQDPFGEPIYVAINHLKVDPDYHQMRFETVGMKQKTQYQLIASQKCDQSFIRIIEAVGREGFEFKDTDVDKINIIFEKGKVVRINCYKRIEFQLTDTLGITREGENLILAQQQPFSRKIITRLEIKNNQIICTTQETTKVYELNVQPRIIQWLAELLN